jgi:hypothetical protein
MKNRPTSVDEKLLFEVMPNSKPSFFEVRLPFYMEFIIALGILLAARASLIFPLNYSCDDYGWGFTEFNISYPMYAQEGRLFIYYFNYFINYLGADFPFLGSFWPIVASAGYICFGLALRNLWIKDCPSVPAIIIALIFSTFPYHSELAIFHIAMPIVTLCLVCGSISFSYLKLPLKSLFIATGLIAVAFTYQLFIPYIFIACVFALLIAYLNNLEKFQTCNVKIRFALSKAIYLIGPVFIAVILSLIIAKITPLISGFESSNRMQPASLSDAPEKTIILVKQLQYFLLRDEIMMPLLFKALQCYLLAVVIFCSYKKLSDFCPSTIQRVIQMILILCFIGIAFASTVAPFLLIKESMMHMSIRALSSIGVFWAGVFAIAWILSTYRVRKSVVLVGTLLVFGYCIKVSQYSVDFARLNMREHLFGNRVLERISEFTSFKGIRSVVFVGLGSDYLREDLVSPVETSFFYPYNAVAVLSEISGCFFEEPTKADITRANELSAGMSLWPHPESVVLDNDLVVISISRKIIPHDYAVYEN